MNKIKIKQQQGFSILSIVLGVVAVSVVIGVWSFSDQNNTSNPTNNSNKIQSSSVMNDAASIKMEYDRLVINGSSSSSIVFIPNVASTLTAPNILDATKGMQLPKLNKNIIRLNASVPEGIWVYNGTTIMLSGIKDTVCKSINTSLYSSNVIPAVTSVTNSAAFVTGATISAPTTTNVLDLSAVPAANGWTSGCVSANGVADNNLYFRILKQGGCSAAPTATQTAYCSTGYSGSWTQTRTYNSAPAPTCWTPSGWTPASAPPGACTACTPYGTPEGSYCSGPNYIELYADGDCGTYEVNRYYVNGQCGQM